MAGHPFRPLLLAMLLPGEACRDPAPPPLAAESPLASEAEARPAWFERPTDNGGIEFTYRSGHEADFLMPEIMGGGAALFDMEGDGDLDAYLVQGGSVSRRFASPPSDRLFRNRGDGSFEEVLDRGAEDTGYGQGVAAGDYDNDGDPDLYITNVGPNALLRNDGGGRFTDVTAEAGVGDPGWGTSATFFDFDRDGHLDLFVANYLNWSRAAERDCHSALGERDYCAPAVYEAPAPDVLYHNGGDGRFEDVSEAAGLRARFGTGLGVVAGDFDRDGWPDLFVANDGMPNQLWLNQGDGTFRDEALLAGCAVDADGKAKAGMGVAAADVDDDGDAEILVGNLRQETDSFYRNDGGLFTDITRPAGLAAASHAFTRFGLALLDFDNDGHLDLFEANGRVTRQSPRFGSDRYAEPSLLFRGTGSGVFRQHPQRGGSATPLVGSARAAAFGDVDNDGGVDILLVHRDAPAALLRNVVPNRGHWLLLRVVDEHGRDALGATVQLRIASRTVTREVRSGYSYLASNDPRVHVGLAGVTSAAIAVRWPDGLVEEFGDHGADQVLELRRSRGLPRIGDASG